MSAGRQTPLVIDPLRGEWHEQLFGPNATLGDASIGGHCHADSRDPSRTISYRRPEGTHCGAGTEDAHETRHSLCETRRHDARRGKVSDAKAGSHGRKTGRRSGGDD